MNEKFLKEGTFENVQLFDEILSNLKEIKLILLENNKHASIDVLQLEKFETTIDAITLLRENTHQVMINGKRNLNENFTSIDVRNFFNKLG